MLVYQPQAMFICPRRRTVAERGTKRSLFDTRGAVFEPDQACRSVQLLFNLGRTFRWSHASMGTTEQSDLLHISPMDAFVGGIKEYRLRLEQTSEELE